MKKLKLLMFIASFVTISFVPAPVQAVNVFDACSGNADSKVCKGKDEQATPLVKTIINLMLFGLGITAVFLIIHSGIKYTTSRGDPANIKSAKDTLLYAIVGLVVALLAFTIVNFVIGVFGGK